MESQTGRIRTGALTGIANGSLTCFATMPAFLKDLLVRQISKIFLTQIIFFEKLFVLKVGVMKREADSGLYLLLHSLNGLSSH